MRVLVPPLTFGRARRDYLMWLEVERNAARTTVLAYRTNLDRLGWHLAQRFKIDAADIDMAAIEWPHLRSFQKALAVGYPNPSTRFAYLVPIRGWLRWLGREGLIDDTLSGMLTLPKIPQTLPKALDSDDLTRLLSIRAGTDLQSLRNRAFVHFMLSTGCRISEALSLDRDDVPPHGDSLIVMGKGRKERAVYLTTDARKAMDAWLAARRDDLPAVWISSARGYASRRMDRAAAGYVLESVARQVGLRGHLTPHVLRHCTATYLLEVTSDVRIVQEVLGHANLATLTRYTKVSNPRVREAYADYGTHLHEMEAAR